MIVVDTGPIVALLNDRDDQHGRCMEFLANHPGPLLVPTTVFTEVCMLVERRRGTRAELAFLGSPTSGLGCSRELRGAAAGGFTRRATAEHTGVRVLGSAALAIAQVALGHAVAAVLDDDHERDVAAGVCLAVEAGAHVVDAGGGPDPPPRGGVLVAAPGRWKPCSDGGRRRAESRTTVPLCRRER